MTLSANRARTQRSKICPPSITRRRAQAASKPECAAKRPFHGLHPGVLDLGEEVIELAINVGLPGAPINAVSTRAIECNKCIINFLCEIWLSVAVTINGGSVASVSRGDATWEPSGGIVDDRSVAIRMTLVS
jgi:hypothetical protein